VSAARLAVGDFQDIETGMSEGHPCFVANNGRFGFDAAEYRAYAPEAASPLRLIWLAARRARATYTAGAGLDYAQLMAAELDEQTRDRFTETLEQQGLDPADYLLLPVHPWQWWNKLSVTFASDVAQRRLVCLGHGDDTHRRGRRTAPAGRTHPRGRPGRRQAAVAVHRRLRLLLPLPGGPLDTAGVLGEDAFWATVADCVGDYQESVPHLADRFARYDLWTERFALSCLNRLQLRNNRQMVDLQDPAGALQLVGTLENPLARQV
jgi:siderophore synthetase component